MAAATLFQRNHHPWSEPEQPTPAFMIFDIEVEDTLTVERARRLAEEHRVGALIGRIAAFRSPHSNSFESQLVSDVRRFKWACLEEEGACDNVVIATKLANIGYTVSLRTAIGGGQGTECFHHLHHETLRVVGEGSQHGTDFIIDTSFREQFTISNPTPAYDRLMHTLPAEFVGPSSRLAPLVQLMCEEMATAFHTRGAMPPPWRQTKAMLSKWLPSKSRDLLLAANIPTSPTSSEGASSFRDSASYLLDSSSPISTLAPWKNTSSPTSSLPAFPSRSEYPRQTAPSRASSDSVRLKSALSSDLAAMNSAKSRQHVTSNHATNSDPVQHLSRLPGMERIFTVKMRGW